MAKYIRIYYRDTEINSIKDLLDEEKIVNLKISDFLEAKDPYSERKNRDALFAAYTEQQKQDLGLSSSKDISEGTKIYPPAVLYAPVDNATIDIIKSDSKFIKTEDYDAFLDEEIKRIVNAGDYKKEDTVKSYPKANVWYWSKSIEGDYEVYSDTIDGRIMNISDFLENLDFSVSETGGSFTITIPLIPATEKVYLYQDGTNQMNMWDIDTYHEKKYTNENGETERVYTETIHEEEYGVTVAVSKKTGELIHPRFIPYERRKNFQLVSMNVNDIVFIKCERLQSETNEHVKDLFVDPAGLEGEIFDMIGLIDSVTIDTDNSDVNIVIQGRDLMKLILDDGTFFYPNSYSDPNAQSGVFINIDEDKGDGSSTLNKFFESGANSAARFVSTGIIMPWFNPKARTIENVLDVLIKTLANIQICPDNLFEAYGDKRTRFIKEKRTKKR